MRKYALVIFDSADKIIDRYNLDLTTDPSGNGFVLSLDKIQGTIEDILTKVAQNKQAIKMTVNQYQNSYSKSRILTAWIEKYSRPDNVMCLEYSDGNIVMYCEGRVTRLDKTELDEYGVLAQKLEFTPLTPMFIKQEQKITIRKSTTGKFYPYTYPYCYGSTAVENNEIMNTYIQDIPLIITIHGAIVKPSISLTDEDGNVYTSVSFSSASLSDDEYIVINSAQRKIYKVSPSGIEDYVPNVDPKGDTFLRAKEGYSQVKINVETGSASDNFYLSGSWRQYTL